MFDKKTLFKFVRAIYYKGKPGQKFLGVSEIKTRHNSFNLDVRIQRTKFALRGNRLGQHFPRIGFIKKNLPLQIGWLHEIPVQDADTAHARTDQQIGNRRTDGPAADNHSARTRQARLSFRPNTSEQHLTGVLLVKRRSHVKWIPSTAGSFPLHHSAKVTGGGNAPVLRFVCVIERMKCRWNNGLQAILLLGLALGGARSHAQTSSESQAGKPAEPRLTSVRAVTEDGKVLQAQLQALPVQVGQPLHLDQVAASIRILYQSGDYADLRAVVYPEGDGARLDFIARENLYFNQILIKGLTPPPTEASAVAAMQLSLGQTYHEQDVKDAVERLRDALREEGLYRAKISVQERPFPETHQLDVIVNLDPGPRVRAKKIDLINNTEYRDADLLARFKLRPGSPLTIAKVQSGTERIRKFLEKKAHLSARVSVRRGELDAAINTIPLTLD